VNELDARCRAGVKGALAAWQEERQTMDARGSRGRRRKPFAAGTFQPEISSFRLALAAEAKAAKTVRNTPTRSRGLMLITMRSSCAENQATVPGPTVLRSAPRLMIGPIRLYNIHRCRATTLGHAAEGAPSLCAGGVPAAGRKVAYLKRRPGCPGCWLLGQ
jgi:hypothetical protein